MMRRLALFCFGLCYLALAANSQAAEIANQRSLGFSPDGRYFAFMQWGVSDGLGAPYGDVFILEVAENSWVGGSPIRFAITDEAEVNQIWETEDNPALWAHDQVLEQAEPHLQALHISQNDPGILLLRRTIYDRSAPADLVRFSVFPTSIQDHTLRLSQRQVSSDCDYQNRSPRIFTLVLEADGAPPRTLQADSQLPESRGCALGYRIHDVILHRPSFDDPAALVVIIAYSLPGFEGDDVRFLAVSANVDGFRW